MNTFRGWDVFRLKIYAHINVDSPAGKSNKRTTRGVWRIRILPSLTLESSSQEWFFKHFERSALPWIIRCCEYINKSGCSKYTVKDLFRCADFLLTLVYLFINFLLTPLTYHTTDFCDPLRVVVCGYANGGALASLAAPYAALAYPSADTRLTTFGAPE